MVAGGGRMQWSKTWVIKSFLGVGIYSNGGNKRRRLKLVVTMEIVYRQ